MPKNVGKAYQIYDRYDDRLKQALFGRSRDFHHKYWALRDVSLDIRRGECVGFVGRNGSGKTTFLQMVCGITAPTVGDLRVVGNIAPILALGAAFDLDLRAARTPLWRVPFSASAQGAGRAHGRHSQSSPVSAISLISP